MTERTALVTGGAGFIGSHLVDRLLADGDRVAVIDDLSSGRTGSLSREAELHELDICSAEIAGTVARIRPDIVFHFAAQMSVSFSVREPVIDARINVMGSLNLMEAVRGSGNAKFVFASTGGAIYGEPERIPVVETDPRRPLSPYAASKFAVEQYLATYRAAYGFDYSIVRLGNVYGPRQDPHGEAGVIAIFMRAMLADEPVRIFGDGTDQRDYVYVSDAVDAALRAAQDGEPTAYNVGSGVGTDVNTLARRLAVLTGYRREPAYAAARDGDLRRIVLDSTKAERELGWRRRVGLDEGLERTVDFFRDEAGG
jgi:UDP-glucose 4-epimerase